MLETVHNLQHTTTPHNMKSSSTTLRHFPILRRQQSKSIQILDKLSVTPPSSFIKILRIHWGMAWGSLRKVAEKSATLSQTRAPTARWISNGPLEKPSVPSSKLQGPTVAQTARWISNGPLRESLGKAWRRPGPTAGTTARREDDGPSNDPSSFQWVNQRERLDDGGSNGPSKRQRPVGGPVAFPVSQLKEAQFRRLDQRPVEKATARWRNRLAVRQLFKQGYFGQF